MSIELIVGISGIIFGLFGIGGSIINFFYSRYLRLKEIEEQKLLQEEQKLLQEKQKLLQEEKDRLQEEKEIKLKEEIKRKDRINFLISTIMDRTIPIKSRQPFYDEYISLGENGTVLKYWLEEVSKDDK